MVVFLVFVFIDAQKMVGEGNNVARHNTLSAVSSL